MKLYKFIKDFEYFLQGKLKCITFLKQVDEMEEEKTYADRNTIVKALEILDNIRLKIDSSGFNHDNLREELKKLSLLIKKYNTYHDKASGAFMVSLRDFKDHYGIKTPLNSNSVNVHSGKLIDLISILKQICLEKSEKHILDKLDTLEDQLIDMEEYVATNNSDLRDIIMKIMEIIDNIRIITGDEQSIDENNLYTEINKLTEREHSLNNYYNPPVEDEETKSDDKKENHYGGFSEISSEEYLTIFATNPLIF